MILVRARLFWYVSIFFHCVLIISGITIASRCTENCVTEDIVLGLCMLIVGATLLTSTTVLYCPARCKMLQCLVTHFVTYLRIK